MSEAVNVSGGRLNYRELFHDWELKLARGAVSRFKSRYPWLYFPGYEDLLQECLAHWCFTRDFFEPDRGTSRKTYMSRVIDMRLQEILRDHMYHIRRINTLSCPLEGQVPDRDITADLILALDVRSALAELTPFQRDICILLGQEYPVQKIAGLLGRPRSTVRDQISKIRMVFLRRGLKNY